MIIKGATRDQIEAAVDRTSRTYSGNIRIKSIAATGHTRAGAPKFSVTITCKTSKGPGARRSPEGRKVAAACWHAHGVFIDSLPASAQVESMGVKTHPGAPWRDWNAGSMRAPKKMSQCCECRR